MVEAVELLQVFMPPTPLAFHAGYILYKCYACTHQRCDLGFCANFALRLCRVCRRVWAACSSGWSPRTCAHEGACIVLFPADMVCGGEQMECRTPPAAYDPNALDGVKTHRRRHVFPVKLEWSSPYTAYTAASWRNSIRHTSKRITGIFMCLSLPRAKI